MNVNQRTREGLAVRRERRDMVKAGWEFVGEGGGKLWELYRGYRIGHKITDSRVSGCGLGVWIKVQNETNGNL